MNVAYVYVGLFLLFIFLSSETVDDNILTLMAIDLIDLTEDYYINNNPPSSLSTGNDTGTLVLEGATLIDGTGAPSKSDAVIVINDGKIIDVTNQTNYNDNLYFNDSNGIIQTGVRFLNLTGKYVIPGLFDTHAHVAGVRKDSYGTLTAVKFVILQFDILYLKLRSNNSFLSYFVY